MQKMAKAEKEVMKILWTEGKSLTAKELLTRLSNKDWKITTVLTFLARLVEKGFLVVEKDGRTNVYTPVMTEQEYIKECSKGFLDTFYNGSIKNFCAAFYEEGELSQDDMAELLAFLKEKGGEK